MHCTVIGKGKPIIFLHGLGLNSSMFVKTAKALNARCYLVDLRGHGKSPGKAFSLDDIMKDIIQMMKKEKLRKAFFVGHSWGGFIALHFARRHPEKVSKILLINSLPALKLSYLKMMYAFVWHPLFNFLVLVTKKRFVDFSKIKNTDSLNFFLKLSQSTGISSLNSCRSMMFSSPVKKVSLPVVILRCSEDNILSYKPAKVMQEMFKAKVMIVGGDHFFPITHPGNCGSIIAKLL